MSPSPSPGASTPWMLDVACGMTAGVAYVVSAHPFDTVKVAQQSRPSSAPALSALATARAIARGPAGPLGLFKGLSAPLVGYSLEAGINYSAYSQARQWLDVSGPWAGTPRDARPLSSELFEAAASGALGGLLLSVVVAPTDLIKCRVQDGQYVGPREAVADIYRRDGARGFTRGRSPPSRERYQETPSSSPPTSSPSLPFRDGRERPGSPAKRLRTKARGDCEPPSLV